jgi:catechol 2,3-dioxygenase-like lactoylglutathione lyase family enzyme
VTSGFAWKLSFQRKIRGITADEAFGSRQFTAGALTSDAIQNTLRLEKDMGSAMAIEKLDHYTIRTEDLEATRRFYTEVLGLSVGPRPAFTFPGLWLYAGRDPMVHVIGVEPAAAARSDDGTGRLDHVAFMGSDIAAMRERFRASGTAFQERLVPTLNLEQIFVRDPNGIKVELNFPV